MAPAARTAERVRHAPEDYPWVEKPRSSMLLREGERSLTAEPGRRLGMSLVGRAGRTSRLNEVLVRENAPFIDSRVLVVAVGSNASPGVISRKYDRADRVLSRATPFMRCTVDGIGIGHSAHVAKGGYIPATPFARAHHSETLVASWFDHDQLQVVDDTEPNYDRVLVSGLDYPLTLESGERPEHFYLYVSRHGLIRDPSSDAPLRFRRQGELFEWLERTSGDPVFSGSSTEVCGRLAEAEMQRAVGRRLKEAGASTHGLRLQPASRAVDYGGTRDLSPASRDSLVVLQTTDSVERNGENVVTVSTGTRDRLELGSHAVVSARSAVGQARPGVVVAVRIDDALPAEAIGVDQIVRNALGVERQEHVSVRPATVRRSILGDRLIGRSTVLFCRVEAADLANVEQDVALCDPLVLQLLGIEDASRIVIEGAPEEHRDSVPTLRIRAVTTTDELSTRRRELSGGSLTARYPSASDALGVFPDLPRIYLDSKFRKNLGLGAHKLTAVRVRASRRDQAVRELRELVLILALSSIGIVTSIASPLVVGAFTFVIGAALYVVRERLRGQLGVRRTRFRR